MLFYLLSTKKNNGFEQDDQTDPDRDEIHDFICPEQLETAAFPGKRKKPENAFVQMLLKCIEERVKKGTAEKIEECFPADRRFKQEGQKNASQYHAERRVKGDGPVFCRGKQNIKWTRENIRQNRSEVKQNSERNRIGFSPLKIERPSQQMGDGHVCHKVRHVYSARCKMVSNSDENILKAAARSKLSG